MPKRISILSLFSLITVALVYLFFHTGCEPKPSSPVIAKVGNSILTLDDLYASMPPEYSEQITREQNINYVRHWIDTEILYQEALRNRIHREPVIKERLKRMKKDLLSAEMISRSATNTHGSVLSEQDVHEYYLKHRQEFLREQDVAKFLEIVVEDLASAHEIRRAVNHENFLDIAISRSKFPVTDQNNTPFVSMQEIHPALSQAITNSAVPGIVGPVRTEDGFHVLQVINRYDKGGISTEEEVRDEIIELLSNKTQKREAERMISEVRLKTNVELNFDQIPGLHRSEKPLEESQENVSE